MWRLERKRCRFFLHFNATALETWPKQILLSRINFCQQWMIRYRSLQQLLIFTFPQMYVIVWFVVVRMYQCTSFFLLHYKMANHEFQVNIQPKVQFSECAAFKSWIERKIQFHLVTCSFTFDVNESDCQLAIKIVKCLNFRNQDSKIYFSKVNTAHLHTNLQQLKPTV